MGAFVDIYDSVQNLIFITLFLISALSSLQVEARDRSPGGVDKRIKGLKKRVRALPDFQTHRARSDIEAIKELLSSQKDYQHAVQAWQKKVGQIQAEEISSDDPAVISFQQILGLARGLTIRQFHLTEGLNKSKPLQGLTWFLTQGAFYQSLQKSLNNFLKNENSYRAFIKVLAEKDTFQQDLEELASLVSTLTKEKPLETYEQYKNQFPSSQAIRQQLSFSSRKKEKHLQNLIDLLGKQSLKIDPSLPFFQTPGEEEELEGLSKLGYNLSRLFGNTVGEVKWRKGHLLKNTSYQKKLKGRLEPFDILIERSPFALTDYIIPGHFGHAALWLGSPEELKKRGLWNLPALNGLREKLKNGKRIIEALRPGVRLASLKQFMSIDEVLVLRHSHLAKNHIGQRQVLTRALNQYGKDYDFNFDVSTTKTVVCSELIYHAFWMIHWPTDSVLGRETISPDDLVKLLFYKNSPLEFIEYTTAKRADRVQNHTKEDLAQLFNFRQNDNGHFDKVRTICERNQWSRVRVGSRLQNRIRYRQCRKEFEQINYLPLSFKKRAFQAKSYK